jgi:hypothetical protein
MAGSRGGHRMLPPAQAAGQDLDYVVPDLTPP